MSECMKQGDGVECSGMGVWDGCVAVGWWCVGVVKGEGWWWGRGRSQSGGATDRHQHTPREGSCRHSRNTLSAPSHHSLHHCYTSSFTITFYTTTTIPTSATIITTTHTTTSTTTTIFPRHLQLLEITTTATSSPPLRQHPPKLILTIHFSIPWVIFWKPYKT